MLEVWPKIHGDSRAKTLEHAVASRSSISLTIKLALKPELWRATDFKNTDAEIFNALIFGFLQAHIFNPPFYRMKSHEHYLNLISNLEDSLRVNLTPGQRT